jgi:hypothetical protein
MFITSSWEENHYNVRRTTSLPATIGCKTRISSQPHSKEASAFSTSWKYFTNCVVFQITQTRKLVINLNWSIDTTNGYHQQCRVCDTINFLHTECIKIKFLFWNLTCSSRCSPITLCALYNLEENWLTSSNYFLTWKHLLLGLRNNSSQFQIL